MRPGLAALSMAEIIAWSSFASGFAPPAAGMLFCIPRRRVRTLRLRRERRVVCRARLEADRVLAMIRKLVRRGGSRRATHLSTRQRPENYALRPKCGCCFNAFL